MEEARQKGLKAAGQQAEYLSHLQRELQDTRGEAESQVRGMEAALNQLQGDVQASEAGCSRLQVFKSPSEDHCAREEVSLEIFILPAGSSGCRVNHFEICCSAADVQDHQFFGVCQMYHFIPRPPFGLEIISVSCSVSLTYKCHCLPKLTCRSCNSLRAGQPGSGRWRWRQQY